MQNEFYNITNKNVGNKNVGNVRRVLTQKILLNYDKTNQFQYR